MKRLMNLGAVLLAVIVLSGCGKKPQPIGEVVADLKGQTVVIKSKIPYAEGSFIKAAVKNECPLQTQLSEFTKESSAEKGMIISIDEKATAQTVPYFLDMKITDAVSRGNAFLGHYKETTIKGTLYKDGKELASFMGRRHSNGGFGAGFKGSCSVLGRTVRTLGDDVTTWLQHPYKDASLGE